MKPLPVYAHQPDVQHYIDQIKNIVGKHIKVDVKFRLKIEADDLIQIVSSEINIAIDVLRQPGKQGVRRMAGRDIFCFIACEYCGFKHEYIASYLDRERSSVCRAVQRVGELREAKDFIIAPSLERIINKLLYEA